MTCSRSRCGPTGGQDTDPGLPAALALFPLPTGEIAFRPELLGKSKTIGELSTSSNPVPLIFPHLCPGGSRAQKPQPSAPAFGEVLGRSSPGATCSLAFPLPAWSSHPPTSGVLRCDGSLELARSEPPHIFQKATGGP